MKNDIKNDVTKKKKDLETSKINERKELFKVLPLNNVPIDKPKIKKTY